METKFLKRNKEWRKQHCKRVFKRRMKFFASSCSTLLTDDGNRIQHPHWHDYAKVRSFKAYKTTSTPCSCWLCKGERYNRAKSKNNEKYNSSNICYK